jgi:hypothetical protein
VFLLAAARFPDRVQPRVRPLSWVGKDALVCAGPTQDLLCLAGDTGAERWRVERVWEFQRDFIGPSVWRHFFRRAGDPEGEMPLAKPPKEKRPKKPGAAGHVRPGESASIVGGPIVVPAPKGRRRPGGDRIFVAVARGPARFAEYLSDCVAYELRSNGWPRAVATLPRMVQGGRYQVRKDGVIWACQGRAFVKLGLSPPRAVEGGGGPGGPNLLCRIDWYRQLARQEPQAWLTADAAGDPLAFGSDIAVRVAAGGYVTDPDKPVYRFPLALVDLRTGAEHALVLNVPYKGKLPEPKTNYSMETLDDGKKRWQAMGPHVMAVTGLEVQDNRLRVTLGMEGWAAVLAFDTAGLLGRKGG